jgi:nitrogen fixation protein FixH
MRFALTEHNRWPIGIAAALIAQVAFGVWMARLAKSDPHFAVLPDYYARGVAWDSTMAQAQRDKDIGWRASITMTRNTAGADVQVALRDRSGSAFRADSVTVYATAIAHSMRVDTVRCDTRDSLAVGTIARAPGGLWELTIRAHRGADLFTAVERVTLP